MMADAILPELWQSEVSISLLLKDSCRLRQMHDCINHVFYARLKPQANKPGIRHRLPNIAQIQHFWTNLCHFYLLSEEIPDVKFSSVIHCWCVGPELTTLLPRQLFQRGKLALWRRNHFDGHLQLYWSRFIFQGFMSSTTNRAHARPRYSLTSWLPALSGWAK